MAAVIGRPTGGDVVRRPRSGYLSGMPQRTFERRHGRTEPPATEPRPTSRPAPLRVVATPADGTLADRLDAELARPHSALAGLQGSEPTDDRDAAVDAAAGP